MTARIPKSLSGPVVIECIEDDDGSIYYELWDHGKKTYHFICGIYPDPEEVNCKQEAEFMALAINNAIGALTAIAKTEARPMRHFVICPTCNGEREIGSGRMSHTVNTATIDPPWEVGETCPTCNGVGYVEGESEPRTFDDLEQKGDESH